MNKSISDLTKDELVKICLEQEEHIQQMNVKVNQLSKEYLISHELFEYSPTPMWEEDITDLMEYLDSLKEDGVTDFDEYFTTNKNELLKCINLIKLVNVNLATVKLHSAKSKEHLINNLPRLFTDKSLNAFKYEIISIANGEVDYECETNANSFTNEIIDLKLHLHIIKREKANKSRIFALVSTIDISKEKNAKIKLKQSEETLRTILDTSTDAALLVDENGFIIESNATCQNLFGVKKIDLIGRNLKHFATKDILPDMVETFNKAVTSKRTVTFKNEAFNKHWLTKISPIVNKDNSIEKVVIYQRDETQKHLTEKRLKDSELKYRSIFHSIQISITHVNKDGFITDINDFHINNISKGNFSKEYFIGKNILERETLNAAGIIDYYKDLLKGKEFKLTEVFCPTTTGGESKYFNFEGVPLFKENEFDGAIITSEDVTTKVVNRKKYLETQERLELAFEGAGIGFWDHDMETNLVWRSDSWFEMLGYSKTEFTDELNVWQNLIHPEDQEYTDEMVRAHLEEETSELKVEHRMLNSKGNYQWVLNWGKVILRKEDGAPLKAAGIHMDITDRKMAQLKEKEMLKSYSDIFNNAIDAIYLLNRDGEFITVNDAAERMYGYSQEEFIGKTPEFLSAPGKNDMHVVKENLVKAFNGERIEFDFWGLRKNGEQFPKIVRLSKADYLGEESVVAFGLDITDRYLEELKRKKSEENYTSLVEQANEGIIINEDWKIKFCNNYFLEMLGYEKEEVLNSSIDNFLAKDILPEARNQFAKRLRGEPVPNIYEARAVKKDGTCFPIEINAQLMNYDGNPAVQSIVRDISDRKETEAKLKKTTEQLQFAIEGSRAGLWDWQVQTGECEFSERWAEIIGYSLSELTPTDINTWLKFAHPDDLERSNQKLNDHFIGNTKAYSCEARMRHKNGDWRWVIDRGKVVEWDNDGKPVRMVGTHIDITNQKIIENNLEEQVKSNKQILETTLDGYLAADANGKIIDANPAYCEMIGYSLEELQKMNILDLETEMPHDEVTKKIKHILASGNARFETTHTHKNGSIIFLDASITVMSEEEKSIIVAFVRDITERIKAAEELEKRNNQILNIQRQLINAQEVANIGSWNWDMDSEIVNWSEQMYRILGYEPGKVEADYEIAKAHVHPEDLDLYESALAKAIETNTEFSLENRIISFDNKIKWVKSSGKIVTDENNNPLSMIGTVQDITDRKTTEFALQESENKYRSLFNNNLAAVTITDNAGKIITANPAFINAFGYSEIELVQMTMLDFYAHQTDRELFLQEMNDKGIVENMEVQMKTKSGTIFWVNFSSAKIIFQQQSVFITTAIIIEDRKKAEKELEENKLRYQRVSESISDYAYGFSVSEDGSLVPDWTTGAFNKITGYTQDELKQLGGWERLILNDDYPIIEEQIKSLMAGNAKVVEYRIVAKDGSIRWTRDYARPQIDEKKKRITHIFGAVQDITKYKTAEQKLVENESQLRMATERTGLVYSQCDTELRYTWIYNPPPELSIDMIVGKTDIEIADNEGTRQYTEMKKEVLASKKKSRMDIVFPSSNGAIIYDIIAEPAFDVNGICIGVSSSALDITERIKTQRKLKESEERLRLTITATKQGIYDINLITGNSRVNNEFAEMLEYLPEEFNDSIEDWKNRLHPDDFDYATNIFQDYIKGKSDKYNLEFRQKTKSGKWKWIQSIGKIVEWDKNGIPTRMLGTHTDITERKNSEKALKLSEEKYRMLVENQTDLVVEIDAKNCFKFISPSYTKIFGKTEKDLIGKSFYPLLHEDDVKSTAEAMKKLFIPPHTCRIEQRAMTKNGWRWFEWYDRALHDDDNKFVSIVGVGRDITDKKIAENALRDSEERFKQLFNNMGSGVAIYDPINNGSDFVFVALNKTGEQLSKVKSNEVVGRKVSEIFPSIKEIGLFDVFKKVNKTGKPIDHPLKLYKDNRIEEWVENYVYKLPSGQIVAIYQDTSEQKKTLEALKESEENLRNLSRYLNNIREEERKNVAREVHDNLGQKLTALNLDVAWIKQNIPDEVKEIKEQFDPVLDLIEQSIVTVQRISTELRPGILDDLGLVNAIQWQSNEISRRTKLKFTLNLSKDELELSDIVKTSLFRVYQEALTNIVRHANAKSVKVNLESKRKKIIFEIIDDGDGIDQNIINDLTSFGIIGMKERIAAINGDLRITKPRKNGTNIRITVPIKEKL